MPRLPSIAWGGVRSKQASKRQPDRRIADHDVAAGVVVGGPQPRQLTLIRLGAELNVLDLCAEQGGDFSVTLVEVFRGEADALPFGQAFQHALERGELVAEPIPDE